MLNKMQSKQAEMIADRNRAIFHFYNCGFSIPQISSHFKITEAEVKKVFDLLQIRVRTPKEDVEAIKPRIMHV